MYLMWLSLTSEVLALWIFIHGLEGWTAVVSFLILHPFASILMTFFLLRTLPYPYKANPYRTLLFCFPICLSVPIVGPPALLLFFKMVNSLKPRLHLTEKYEVLETENPVESHALSKSLTTGNRLKPYIDLLRYPDSEMRRHIVLSLPYLDRQKAISILKKALQDRDEEVRTFAFLILCEMEDRITKEMSKLIKQCQTDGYTPAKCNLIAEDLYELSRISVGSHKIREFFLKKSIEFLKTSLDCNPDQPKVYFQIAQYAMELGNADLAAENYQKAILEGFDVQKILLKEAELAYTSRDFEKLLSIINFLKDESLTDDSDRKAIDFWAGR